MSSPPTPTASPAAPPPRLDETALGRLRELDPDGRHGVMRRVLQAFDASLSRMLLQLAAEREGGSPAVVSGIAHTLKSSAGSVGALLLAAVCAAVEKRQHGAGDSSHLRADIDQLQAEGQAALNAVRAMLRI